MIGLDYTSAGASASNGMLNLDGVGGSVNSGGGSIDNLTITSGTHDFSTTDVTGDLIVTGGTLGILAAQTVTFSRTNAIGHGDLDRDGDVDLVLGYNLLGGSGVNAVYWNDGGLTFVPATGLLPPIFDETWGLAVHDLDGDDDLDLLFGNDGQNRLLLNDGSGSFVEATATRLPPDSSDTQSIAVRDVNGDQLPDFVAGNLGVSELYLNVGGAFFSNATATHMPALSHATSTAVFGDFDLDLDPDLVLGVDSGQNQLYLNDGTGHFTDATAARLPVAADATRSALTGDLDEDGDLDLFFGNRNEPSRLYLNDGTGHFIDASGRLPEHAVAGRSAALQDIDGDGDLDIVTVDIPGQDRVWLNHHRQLHTPWFARPGRAFSFEVYAEPGYGTTLHTGVVILGFGLAATPTVLPGIGSFYLDPILLIALPPVAIPPATGRGRFDLPLIADPSLVGATLAAQAVVIHGVTGRARLTNATVDTVRGL